MQIKYNKVWKNVFFSRFISKTVQDTVIVTMEDK